MSRFKKNGFVSKREKSENRLPEKIALFEVKIYVPTILFFLLLVATSNFKPYNEQKIVTVNGRLKAI